MNSQQHLVNLSDDSLADLAREIQQEKDDRWWTRVLAVAKQAKAMPEDYFQTVAHAMFYQCSISHSKIAAEAKELMPKDVSIQEVALHLAEIAHLKHRAYCRPLLCQNEEALNLYTRIKSFFDESNFVFGHTYYEYCDNGYYYRMS